MAKLPGRRPFVGTSEIWRANLDFFARMVDRDLAEPVWQPRLLANIVENALGNAARRTLVDLGDRAIAADLVSVACASAALFAVSSLPAGTERTVPHPSGATTTARSTGLDPDAADPIHWRSGLLAALVVRHRAALEMLTAVSPETLHALWPGVPDWMTHERAALSAVARLTSGGGDALVRAATAADPDAVPGNVRAWVLDIVTPELQLAFAAIAHDQAHFDDWMAKAIRCHHHYFGSAAEKKNVDGLLALAPLAMACLAHDLGLSMHVESDYLPAWLITHRSSGTSRGGEKV